MEFSGYVIMDSKLKKLNKIETLIIETIVAVIEDKSSEEILNGLTKARRIVSQVYEEIENDIVEEALSHEKQKHTS